MVVGERLGHVLVDLSVRLVEQIILRTHQELSEPCTWGVGGGGGGGEG